MSSRFDALRAAARRSCDRAARWTRPLEHWSFPAGLLAVQIVGLAVAFAYLPEGRLTYTDLPVATGAVIARVETERAEAADPPTHFVLSPPPGDPPTIGVEPSPAGAPPVELDPALIETSGGRILPRIGDGREPFGHFARPSTIRPNDPAPPASIGLIVADLGKARAPSLDAASLPNDVGLAFSVRAPSLAQWQSWARWRGHESLLDLGSGPLLEGEALERALAAGSGYGVVIIRAEEDRASASLDGAPALLATPAIEALDEALRARGLRALALAPESPAMAAIEPSALATAWRLDARQSSEGIDLALAALEARALRGGHAIGWLGASPLAYDRLRRWLGGLERRGLRLAPPSQLVRMFEETSQ